MRRTMERRVIDELRRRGTMELWEGGGGEAFGQSLPRFPWPSRRWQMSCRLPAATLGRWTPQRKGDWPMKSGARTVFKEIERSKKSD